MKEVYQGPGRVPEMKWIERDNFVVDHHYQRQTSSQRSQEIIRKISERFLWARFQPPTVTPGPRGKYVVIDGQHRIAGALLRDDIKKIPCYVVPDLDQKQQAENFVAINRDRAQLHPLAIHHALVLMGDPVALKVKDVCEEADVSIARQPAPNGQTKPRETAALGAITAGLRIHGEENVIAALMIVPEAYKLTPGMMRSSILKVLMRFFKLTGVRNVDRRALIFVLREKDPATLETEAALYCNKNGGRREDAMFNSICRRYRKQRGEA